MNLPYHKIDTRNERLKTLAGKHGSLWDEFNERLDISWIHHDYGLEGVVLHYQEMAAALNEKVASDNTFLPMYQEIKNLKTSIEFARDLGSGRRKRDKLSRDVFIEMYRLLSHKLRGVDSQAEGIRKEDGRYGAYYHKFCPAEEVEECLQEYLENMERDTEDLYHPAMLAARAHYGFMKIMPFGRFSGRMGRLLMNVVLLQHGFPPAIIHTVERARYYEALTADDEEEMAKLLIEATSATVESALQFVEEGIAERRRKREARKALRQQRQEQKQKKSKTQPKKTTKKSTKKTASSQQNSTPQKRRRAAGERR